MIYAFCEECDCFLPAYVIKKDELTKMVRVHFVGKSWRYERDLKIETVFLKKE